METQPEVKRKWSRRGEAEILQILKDHETSHQSQRSFCDERGIALGTFAQWRRRYGSESAGTCSPHFAEVSLSQGMVLGECSESIGVRLVDGTEVFLPSRWPASCLGEYVRALRGLSC